ncbi:unnamed protein product [Orchesella dallaii]|uniref:Cytochrome P450 n=1 Tax=Orchesella dallaii TaxID=48710 RepID=A0ABP1S9C5_9HEXA
MVPVWFLVKELIKEAALPTVFIIILLCWGIMRIKKSGLQRKLDVPYEVRKLAWSVQAGIIFNDGRDFTVQRRFVIQHLKTLGFGKTIMEDFILDELDGIREEIKSHNGKPISTHHLFNIASFNILWRIITGGSRFAHDDPEMSKLVTVLNRFTE